MRTRIVALAVTAGLTATAPAYATTTVVTPADLGPWQTFLVDATGANLTGADGGTSFVEGPAGPPSGTGSARLVTASGHGDGAAQLRNTALAGTPLSAIKTLTYATYSSQTNGAQLPYLRLTVDLDANGSTDDEITFEPVYQFGIGLGAAPQPEILIGSWQVWNARSGLWWSQRGFADATPGAGAKPLDALIAAAPLARIVNTAGRAGGVSLSSGVVAASERFDGNVDAFTIDTGSGPTTYDFEPGPPPPVKNKSAVITAAQGTIKVTLPGKRSRKLRRHGENVPLGTVVDASKGRAAISTSNRENAKPQTSLFYDGVFSVSQRGGLRPITDIKLRSSRFAVLCGAGSASAGAARAGALVPRATRKRRRRSKRVVTSLWGDGKGSFRTTGRNSAATVRGTRWLTQERCDGTLTRVVRGVVRVKLLRSGKVVTVSAGHSYLAPG
ncbi:MAG: hypothetical protein QOE31_570 [Solirubrobacteraceae bacterium]|nr:hypothetical protein [Solirubrobacteraceae bacterium]